MAPPHGLWNTPLTKSLQSPSKIRNRVHRPPPPSSQAGLGHIPGTEKKSTPVAKASDGRVPSRAHNWQIKLSQVWPSRILFSHSPNWHQALAHSWCLMDAPSGRRGPSSPDTAIHLKGLERLTQASSSNPLALAGAGLGVGAFATGPGVVVKPQREF